MRARHQTSRSRTPPLVEMWTAEGQQPAASKVVHVSVPLLLVAGPGAGAVETPQGPGRSGGVKCERSENGGVLLDHDHSAFGSERRFLRRWPGGHLCFRFRTPCCRARTLPMSG